MHIIFLNGGVGVGKSTIGAHLSQKVSNSSWIEGDSFLHINPFYLCLDDYVFIAKKIHELVQYHKTKGIKYSFVSWCIWDERIKLLLDTLFNNDIVSFITIYAPCDEIKNRVIKDVENKKRPPDNLLKVHKEVYTVNSIMVENINLDETVNEIIKIIYERDK